MKTLFEAFGGLIGALFFITSIVFCVLGKYDKALIVDLFTLISLFPYVTINSYREKMRYYDCISMTWKGKIGAFSSLCYMLNQFWLIFLVYATSDSYIFAVIAAVIIFIILPPVYILILCRNDHHFS